MNKQIDRLLTRKLQIVGENQHEYFKSALTQIKSFR